MLRSEKAALEAALASEKVFSPCPAPARKARNLATCEGLVTCCSSFVAKISLHPPVVCLTPHTISLFTISPCCEQTSTLMR